MFSDFSKIFTEEVQRFKDPIECLEYHSKYTRREKKKSNHRVSLWEGKKRTEASKSCKVYKENKNNDNRQARQSVKL